MQPSMSNAQAFLLLMDAAEVTIDDKRRQLLKCISTTIAWFASSEEPPKLLVRGCDLKAYYLAETKQGRDLLTTSLGIQKSESRWVGDGI